MGDFVWKRMGRSFRRRSSSGGSFSEMKPSSTATVDDSAAQELFSILLNLKQPQNGKSFLHSLSSSSEINMAHALLQRASALQDGASMVKQLLSQPDDESGYTPLHWAVRHGNLAAILLLLRQTSSRLSQRPMELLDQVDTKDFEQMTPLHLLGVLQRKSLRECREALQQDRIEPANNRNHSVVANEEQDELALLSENLHLLEIVNDTTEQDDNAHRTTTSASTACEVLTFGRSQNVALGVPCSDATHPQRVAEFGLDSRHAHGSAIVVAAATHHTLVVTLTGDLYACGLGKGGRLGTGHELQCPLFTQVKISRKWQVIHAAAAENHSLCVTSDGKVFAFGSNRFGQLGIAGQDRCFTPRKVEDLRNVHVIQVAAGDKHSMALTRNGQVYTWGDNQAGQLGTRQSSSTGKVQLVESLWNSTPRKVTTAICASEHSSLILTKPTAMGLPVNAVYQWGHGNHVPIKVNFTGMTPGNRQAVNPIDIACAKYHNAAVTQDGHVYTWGLHSEPLGNQEKKKSSMVIASPQLVEGMLPENGGGRAVKVSASEHHTAVVTDCGHLFTWGATFGKNVLGHEGVRWQPSPKQVAGIHRAVSVSAAKEHNVVLMGTNFPAMPINVDSTSLETLAARTVAKHVDVFNVIPILITAERAECTFLKDYCREFIRDNLDGVLCMGRKSEMDCYLNEQLAAGFDEMDRDVDCHPLVYDVIMAGTTSSVKEFDSLAWMDACKSLLERLPVSTFVKYRTSASNCRGGIVSRRTLRRSRTLSIHDEDDGDDQKPGECSERCVMLTANIILKTSHAAQSKVDSLSKEVRSVRKLLNQIAKLELVAESLTSEQQQKVQRKVLLETDLSILEPALVKVEARLRELRLEEEVEVISSSPSMCMEVVKEEKDSDLGTPESCSTPANFEIVKVFDLPENDTVEGDEVVQVFRCDLCSVSCSDANSLALHKNGRKHRNRIKVAEEEEQKEIAASIREDKRRQMLRSGEQRSTVTAPVKKKSPWDRDTKPSTSVQPRYRLPPPPHFPSLGEASLATPQTKKKSKPVWNKPMGQSRKAGGLKSPPSSSASTLLNPGNIPVLASPPWASPAARVPVAEDTRKTYSLADFLAPPSPSVEISKPSPWSASRPKASPSLADIQQEEQEIRNKQPTTRVEGKWYIDQRTRAGSISAIQEAEEKKRQHELLVEEQKQIEEQIQRERQQQEKKKQSRKNSGKRQKKKLKDKEAGAEDAGAKANTKKTGEGRRRSNRKKSNAGDASKTKASAVSSTCTK